MQVGQIGQNRVGEDIKDGRIMGREMHVTVNNLEEGGRTGPADIHGREKGLRLLGIRDPGIFASRWSLGFFCYENDRYPSHVEA